MFDNLENILVLFSSLFSFLDDNNRSRDRALTDTMNAQTRLKDFQGSNKELTWVGIEPKPRMHLDKAAQALHYFV